MPHLDFADSRSRLFRDKIIEVIPDFCLSALVTRRIGHVGVWRRAFRYRYEEPVADP